MSMNLSIHDVDRIEIGEESTHNNEGRFWFCARTIYFRDLEGNEVHRIVVINNNDTALPVEVSK